MGFAFVALSPIFLTIMLGVVLEKTGLMRDKDWQGVDQLAFYVLFPAIIVKSIMSADFGDLPVFRMVAVMVCGMMTMQILMFIFKKPVRRALDIDIPSWTSVFQGTTRWHTFIGLAIMPALFGDKGLALAAVAAGAISPLSNAASIIVMSIYRDDGRQSLVLMAKTLITNPFILGIFTGLAIQASDVTVPATLVSVLNLIGDGALGIALLSVGAALRFSLLAGNFKPIAAAVVLKMAIVPLFMAFYCYLFGVEGLPRTVAILAGSVPTAAVSYIFARKMGGNAELMANIITVQIIVAVFSLPFILGFLDMG